MVLDCKGNLSEIYAPSCEVQQRECNAREDSVRSFFCVKRSGRLMFYVPYSKPVDGKSYCIPANSVNIKAGKVKAEMKWL